MSAQSQLGAKLAPHLQRLRDRSALWYDLANRIAPVGISRQFQCLREVEDAVHRAILNDTISTEQMQALAAEWRIGVALIERLGCGRDAVPGRLPGDRVVQS